MVIIIASDADADRLMRRLVEQGYPATKIGSTGGFLRRGNATVFSGVEGHEVDAVLATVRAECRARSEHVPLQALPFGEGAVLTEPGVEVRVGGSHMPSCCSVRGSRRFETVSGLQRDEDRTNSGSS
jgi:uncharacterized protein YaaQ